MKIKLFLFYWFAIGLFPNVGLTQDPLKSNPYYMWVQNTQSNKRSTGYLRSLSDSTMAISPKASGSMIDVQNIPVSEIKWVKFRDQRSLGEGVVRGALMGFAIGFMYGIIRGDSPCETKSCIQISPIKLGLLYGLYGVPPGALVGGVIGSFKTKITIGGSQENYAKQRIALERFQLGN